MFSTNSISIRLFSGYFIIIIFLGIIAIVSLVKLGSINYLKRSITNNIVLIENISNLAVYKETLIVETHMMPKNGNGQKVAVGCLNVLNKLKNKTKTLINACSNNLVLLQLANSIGYHCNILNSKFNQADPYLRKKILLIGINNLGVVIDAFKVESNKSINELQNSLGGVIRSAFLTILFFFLVTVIFSIFLSITIGYSITNPLLKLIDAAKKIKTGNLFIRVNTDSYDEIGSLSMTFNNMVDTLYSDQQEIREYNRDLELKNLELKNLSHRMFSIQDDERKHLSEVLHEEIGQSLTALKINIKLLEHYYINNTKEVFEEKSPFKLCVDDCRNILGITFASIKSLTFSFKYNILDKMGILAATGYYIEQISKRSPIRIITASNISEESFPDQIKMYLFRIICEALTNVIKHANATLIRLEFASEKENIVLHIFDNGCGFNLEDSFKNRAEVNDIKMGLTTMKELAHIMKGSLQIDSRLSKGTRLIVKIPKTY
ncbi:MAG: ATP-binding protein [Candidatus Anammoxibacter sp.]